MRVKLVGQTCCISQRLILCQFFDKVHRRLWAPPKYIAIMQYMKAVPIARTQEIQDDGAIVEVVIWELTEPLPPCAHNFKYRLYFGTPDAARVRYDNERGKGDHKHLGMRETPYVFTSLETLLDDFERDIEDWSSTT